MGEEGVVLRFVHCSCLSTGRNGIGFDAVFVPGGGGGGEGEGKYPRTMIFDTSGGGGGAVYSRTHQRGGGGPRPPPECAGDPVAEHYARRFISVGRVERSVERPEDVIWRVR